jgi:glycosyltransferase involved in cell wall biosynthesis
VRILLAHKFFEVRGGAEVFFFETGRVLEEGGHDVAYFATSVDPARADGVRTFLVEPPAYDAGNAIRRAGQIVPTIYSRSVKKRFAAAIRAFRPDLIHVFSIHVHLTPSVLSAAREAGVPVVMSCNDYKHICPNYKLFHHGRLCDDCRGGRFYKAAANRCCKNSLGFSVASTLEAYVHAVMNVYDGVHTYLFASEFMARETQRFWPNRELRWRRLRNPFDSTKYPLALEDDHALFFGRLIEEKGVGLLLEAARGAPDVLLKIVGDGPDEPALREQASRLRLRNVEFMGPVWGPRLDELLSRARFVVVPSVWHENYPYVINQAFAFGKPVIGSNRGGIPELVEHERTGLIYDAVDPVALAAAMRTLWDDPGRAHALGRAAKELSDSVFNDRQFRGSLVGIYEEVLGARPRAGG